MVLPRLALFTAALLALTSTFAAEKIVVGFPNPTGFSIGNGPYWMALELKFFEAEGLDVEVINFNGGALVHTQVAQKKIDVGWVNPIDFRQPGRDALPTKFFYNDLGKWIWEIVVLQDSPVRSIQQLKGKTIGVGSLAFSNIPVTRAMLVDAGIKPDVDTKLVAVGMGMSALEALRAGRIDAVNLFDAAHETMAAQGGVAIRRLEMPEKYLSLISNSFNAHEDTIKSRPKALAGFGRAWAKGLVACYANQRACVNAFYSRRPAAKTGAASAEQGMTEALRILESRSRSYFDGDPRSPQRFGEFDGKSFQNYVAILHSQGVLQSASVPVDELYTNALVPEFNKFDRDAVRKQAAALK